MSREIVLPALSPTMTEGNLTKWLKQEGDAVRIGDVIAEVETDKATMEIEAEEEGTIGKIVIPEGTEGVQVNSTIAILLQGAESGEALAKPKPVEAIRPSADAAPARPTGTEIEAPVTGKIMTLPVPVDAGEVIDTTAGMAMSPLARRIAVRARLDLSSIRGSGPNGRIMKSDVEGLLGRAGKNDRYRRQPGARPETSRPSQTAEEVATLAGGQPYELVPHSSMRRTIARRLSESKQTIPHFYQTVDCNVDRLLRARSEINSLAEGEKKVSVNDFVIRAAAIALSKVPAANASWSDEGVLQWTDVDIAVAVAVENGLVTPIVRKANTKGLRQISSEMQDLASRAKAGKLKLHEFQGGSFSISNLGMYGIKSFSAVINPPHGCILAIGAAERRTVVVDDAVSVATMVTCTLSADHRVVDGAVGAEFLGVFKKLMEDPLSFVL